MVVLWLLGLGAALAQPIVLSPQVHEVPLEGRSLYWIDTGTVPSPDQMEAVSDGLPWSVREPGAAHRIDGKALWIRFDAQSSTEKPWFLALESSGIDRVQLFYRSPDGNWVQQEAGDIKAVSAWPLPGRFPTFELSAVVGKPVRYWLRIEHERADFSTPITDPGQSVTVRIARTRTVPAGRLFRPGRPDRGGGRRQRRGVSRPQLRRLCGVRWHRGGRPGGLPGGRRAARLGSLAQMERGGHLPAAGTLLGRRALVHPHGHGAGAVFEGRWTCWC